jgi:prevent-host-death family protein
MLKTINALKARRNLGQLLEEVFYKGDQFVIQRAGKSMAVVISPSEYEAYRKQRESDMQVFGRIREKNTGVELEEIERDVQEAIKAVRTENAQGGS